MNQIWYVSISMLSLFLAITYVLCWDHTATDTLEEFMRRVELPDRAIFPSICQLAI